MKTKRSTKTETKRTRVLGYFRKGSALGDLAQALSDRRPHRLSQTLAGIRRRHKLTPVWRGYGVLKTVGKSHRAFSVVVDREKDSIQLKGGVKPAGPKKTKSKPAQDVSAAA